MRNNRDNLGLNLCSCFIIMQVVVKCTRIFHWRNNEILLEVLKFIDIISINFDRIIHIHDDEIDNNE